MQTEQLAVDRSFNPETGEQRGVVPHTAARDVAASLERAARVSNSVAAAPPQVRKTWIESAVRAITSNSAELVALADEETGLGIERLTGELARMATNAVFYADVACEGSHLAASADRLGPNSTLARWNVAIGPVAVFGASNFPFGYGTFGHDVAAAIAAGCPVLVKAHPAHPRLSARLAELAKSGLASAGAPEGAFGTVVGFDAGLQLVDSPTIKAVAFTGSQGGGMALVERGARRGIPVFAEMGTVNPVFISRSAVNVASIAHGFVESLTLGAGQFCTKPGLVLSPAGSGFAELVSAAIAQVPAMPLLTREIASRYRQGVAEFESLGRGVARGGPVSSGYSVTPEVVNVELDDLSEGSPLLDECFGPVAILAEYSDVDSAILALGRLQPSLAASVFTDEATDADANAVIRGLHGQVGRVVINDWPTGAAAAWSQQHGGPWPATSRSDATSVGAASLGRFLRPVSCQNATSAQLPEFMAPDNPWAIPRRVNGVMTVPTDLRTELAWPIQI